MTICDKNNSTMSITQIDHGTANSSVFLVIVWHNYVMFKKVWYVQCPMLMFSKYWYPSTSSKQITVWLSA